LEETKRIGLSNYRSLSFWHDSLAESLEPRPISANREFEVVIAGAGFTGLWTGIYLLRNQPGLKVAVIEKEIAGFGASGRNGGWCSALFPWSAEVIAQKYGFEEAQSMRKAMIATVDEVGQVTKELGIDCDFQKSGTYTLIRSDAQKQKALSQLSEANKFDIDSLQLLDFQSAPRATKSQGAVFDPACASIHPAKLVRGLAKAFVDLGGELFEKTEVQHMTPGLVRTSRGDFRSNYVVDALEGYRPLLPGKKRESLPLYSLMIATEPIPSGVLDDLEIKPGATFADFRNLIIYGQRTKDNRIAFGGRGAPYHFGSSVKDSYDLVPAIHAHLERELKEMFPALANYKITHQWGGALGVARDWMASVKLDPVTKMAQAGGYVGDGVGTSHLAGKTLADLILRRATPESNLCFVNHSSPKWEFEPLRFIAARGALIGARLADQVESFTGRRSFISRIIALLTGK
jgi:glycine/D-amino acid oxidase-like deaminating enzyme